MSRLSSKNQITIPVEALREAGIEPGEDLDVRATGNGRLEIERRRSWVDELCGCVPGLGPSSAIDELREEWDRSR